MERIVLITSASTGLGLALATHYAAQPSTRVLAVDAAPLPAALAARKNVHGYVVDVAAEGERALEGLKKDLGERGVTILIHPPSSSPSSPALTTLTSLLHALTPALARAAAYAAATGAHRPRVLVVSRDEGVLARVGEMGAARDDVVFLSLDLSVDGNGGEGKGEEMELRKCLGRVGMVY